MVKVKHKQTGEIKEVTISMWDSKKMPHELYDIIWIKDAVCLYMRHTASGVWEKKFVLEKDEALKIVKENPNVYRFEDLPCFPYSEPRLKRKSILNTIKYAITKGTMYGIKIWKFIVTVVITVVSKVVADLIYKNWTDIESFVSGIF